MTSFHGLFQIIVSDAVEDNKFKLKHEILIKKIEKIIQYCTLSLIIIIITRITLKYYHNQPIQCNNDIMIYLLIFSLVC